jgi:hypothetical protein
MLKLDYFSLVDQLIEAGADIYEKIPDGRSALDLCDDPDLRTFMVDFREQNIRNREKAAAAAAAAAAAQTQHKSTNRLQVNTNSLLNGTTSRTGTLYESRSSVSSPYGSGSSLNRTSSIRRASIRDREKVKKLNESFLDVLQAKDKIQEDADENPPTNGIITSTTKLSTREERTSSITTATDSTIREPQSTPAPPTSTNPPAPSVKKSAAPVADIHLPPLKVPPPLPPHQTIADTLSEVKRRREERRRGIGVSSSNIAPAVTSLPLPIPLTDTNHKNNNNNNHVKISNGIHGTTIPDDPLQRYTSPKHIEIHAHHHMIDADREKRICCTIL